MSTSLLEQALDAHRGGDLHRASDLYRQALETDPNNPDALHLLGVVAHQSGDHDAAIELINRAIAQRPNAAAYFGNLAEALRVSGRLGQSIDAYQRAIALSPNFADAYGNLGIALTALGRIPEAVESLRRAVELNPSFLEAHMNLGIALKESGQLDQAVTCFAKVVELAPHVAQAHVNLANALNECGDRDGARDHYEQAIRLRPDLSQAYSNLALMLIDQERFDAARDTFHQLFRVTHGNPLWNAPRYSPSPSPSSASEPIVTTRFSLKNALEHVEYLIAAGRLDASFDKMSEAYRSVLAELPGNDDTTLLRLDAEHSARIAPFFGKVLRFVDAPRVDGSAVNPNLDFRAIEDAYLASPLAVIHFDDFLTPTALRSLYTFCLESTIFLDQARGGFLSSYMGSGFHCSLLFQIAEELKQCFPRLLGRESIGNMWVYRYSSEGEGVRAHTDEGSVTFNFWISPDAGNLDPNGGGLLVYTKEQPLEWNSVRLNLDKDDPRVQQEIESFLSDASSVSVPYRQNRALLFHSNLFHKSERFRFRDDYLNRRMNVTLLFGERGADIRLRYV